MTTNLTDKEILERLEKAFALVGDKTPVLMHNCSASSARWEAYNLLWNNLSFLLSLASRTIIAEASLAAAQAKEIERLRGALEWYSGSRSPEARLADNGERAEAALTQPQPESEKSIDIAAMRKLYAQRNDSTDARILWDTETRNKALLLMDEVDSLRSQLADMQTQLAGIANALDCFERAYKQKGAQLAASQEREEKGAVLLEKLGDLLKECAEKLDRYANRQTAKRALPKGGFVDNTASEGQHYAQIQSLIDRAKNWRNEAAALSQPSDGHAKKPVIVERYVITDDGEMRVESPPFSAVAPPSDGGRGVVTYESFRERVRQLAKDLRDAGFEYPADCVAVADFDCLDHEPPSPASDMKAGGE
jgi:hypothetical protein